MVTALRNEKNDSGEAVIDAQALHILDQEIRDASEELNKSRDGLALIITQQKMVEDNVNSLKEDIKKNEGFVIVALDKKDNNLAEDIAIKLANYENKLESEVEAAKHYKSEEGLLRESINTAELQIKQLKQQTEMIKATEAVQRAQKVVAQRHEENNSKLRTALDSLDRIKENQKLTDKKMSADNESLQGSKGTNLDQKIEAAGIISTTKSQDILDRIKAKVKK